MRNLSVCYGISYLLTFTNPGYHFRPKTHARNCFFHSACFLSAAHCPEKKSSLKFFSASPLFSKIVPLDLLTIQLCFSCTRTHITYFSVLWREIPGYRAPSHFHRETGCGTYNIATTPCFDSFTFSTFTVLVNNWGRRRVPQLFPGREEKLLSNELNFPLPLSSSSSGFGEKPSGQMVGEAS